MIYLLTLIIPCIIIPINISSFDYLHILRRISTQFIVETRQTFKFVLDLKALPQSSQGNGRSVECTTAAWRVSSDLVPNARPHSAQANPPPEGTTPTCTLLSD